MRERERDGETEFKRRGRDIERRGERERDTWGRRDVERERKTQSNRQTDIEREKKHRKWRKKETGKG